MDLPALRRSLLALLGQGTAPKLDPAEWQELDRLAALHRLAPLLHAERGHDEVVPNAIRDGWRAAHRHAAIQALAIGAELEDCCAILEHAGHQPIALKGAWLTRHAYPAPALRPMRDLDIWVPVEGVLSAYQVLLGCGYVMAEPPEMALEDIVRLDKHMPPLLSPRGVVIELHHHLWEPAGRLDHVSPSADGAAIRGRAKLDAAGIRMLAPQDTLAHLIVHAVYSHRLDCGPLLLTDIDFLLRAAPIELAGDPAPPELLEMAPDLLLQELDTRQSAQLAATLKTGPGKLIQRLLGRRSAAGEAAVTRDMRHEGGALGWAASRAWRSASQLARSDVRRQSRQLAALSKWLGQ